MLLHSFGVETVFLRAGKLFATCALVVALTALLGVSASLADAAELKVTTGGTDAGNCQEDPCATIPYAVGQSADGDTIQVGPGEFPASTTATRIVLNKSVTIAGAQAGVDARERDVSPAEETVIVGGNYTGGAIRLSAPGATVDGVTVRAHEHAAIQGMITSSGYTVRNSILTDNDHGLDLETSATGAEPTLIERNRFDGNNRTGLQSGIYADGPINNVTISDNFFTGHANVPVNIAKSSAAGRSDILISGNEFVDERHLLLLDASDVRVLGNTFTDGRSQAISIQGGVTDLRIQGNEIDGAVGAGILFASRYGSATSSDATISDNSISGVAVGSGGTSIDSGAGLTLGHVGGEEPGYAGDLRVEGNRLVGNAGGGIQNDLDKVTVEAPNNWWGCNEGPGSAGCDAVSGQVDPVPNVVLSVKAAQLRLRAGDTSAVTATVNTNSAGQSVSLPVLEGREISFSADQGSVAPGTGKVTDGSVAAKYTSPTAVGPATVTATFDGAGQGADLFVGEAATVSSAGLGGSGLVGEPLTCAAAGVGGLPAPSETTGWLRNGAEINGQSGTSYVPVDADAGARITCRVTAANEFGSASAESSAVTVTRPAKPPVKPPVLKPKKKVTVPASGKVVVLAVKCPSGKCRIKAPKRVKVKIRGKVYRVKVKAPSRIGQGKTAKVRLVLPARARRAIRGGRTKARVKIVVTSNNGKRKVVNRTFVLKGKPRR